MERRSWHLGAFRSFLALIYDPTCNIHCSGRRPGRCLGTVRRIPGRCPAQRQRRRDDGHPGRGKEWLDQRVSFGEGQLTWLGGETCELWSVREADFPVITLEDPNLSDLAIPPLDSIISSGDKRVNVPVDLQEGEKTPRAQQAGC